MPQRHPVLRASRLCIPHLPQPMLWESPHSLLGAPSLGLWVQFPPLALQGLTASSHLLTCSGMWMQSHTTPVSLSCEDCPTVLSYVCFPSYRELLLGRLQIPLPRTQTAPCPDFTARSRHGTQGAGHNGLVKGGHGCRMGDHTHIHC